MTGYLNTRQAAEFLGGRSLSWLRSHLHEIPHRKLYDRLLFDPEELRAFVETRSARRIVLDLDDLVAEVVGEQRKRRPRK
jgi:hypothetical protein